MTHKNIILPAASPKKQAYKKSKKQLSALARLSITDIENNYNHAKKTKEWRNATFSTLLKALPNIMERSFKNKKTLSFQAGRKLPLITFPNRLACLRFLVELASDDSQKKRVLARRIRNLKKPRRGSPYTFSELTMFADNDPLLPEARNDFLFMFLARCGSWELAHAILEMPYAADCSETVGEKFNETAMRCLIYKYSLATMPDITSPEAIPCIDFLLKIYVAKHPDIFYGGTLLEFLKNMDYTSVKEKIFILEYLLNIDPRKRSLDDIIGRDAEIWYALARLNVISFADAYRKGGRLLISFRESTILEIFKIYKDLSTIEKTAFLASHELDLKLIFETYYPHYENRTPVGQGFCWLTPEMYITTDHLKWAALINIFRSVLPETKVLPYVRQWLEECNAAILPPKFVPSLDLIKHRHLGLFNQKACSDSAKHETKDDIALYYP